MYSSSVREASQYSLTEREVVQSNRLSTSSLSDVLARGVFLPADVHERARKKLVIKKTSQISNFDSQTFKKCVEALSALLALPPGWNSYSAKPIQLENVLAGIYLLAGSLSQGVPAPNIVPRVRGGVQFEWHVSGLDVEVYIDSPASISLFAENTDTGEISESVVKGRDPVLSFLLQRMARK